MLQIIKSMYVISLSIIARKNKPRVMKIKTVFFQGDCMVKIAYGLHSDGIYILT